MEKQSEALWVGGSLAVPQELDTYWLSLEKAGYVVGEKLFHQG